MSRASLPLTPTLAPPEAGPHASDKNWPADGLANRPATPDDPRAVLRDMIDAGLVDLAICRHLLVTLEAYRRGVIEL